MSINYLQLAESIASIYNFPVPLKNILDDEGIILFCDDYGQNSFDGLTMYETTQDTFYIHLNTARNNHISNPKGRFTLAHELGHYFIDKHRLSIINGNMQPHWYRYNPFGENKDWLIEREADNFAASLLMPSRFLLNDLKNNTFSGNLISYLATKYNVSFSAMAIRCLHLDYIPLMLVYAENSKIKWQIHSNDFPFWRLKYGDYRLPENSVIGSYFYSNDIESCRKDEIVVAGDCFHVTRSDDTKLKLYEYCIPHQNKALSIFWI